MARPKKLIDYKLLDNLCAIQCTGEEIATAMEMDYDTLNTRIKEDTGIGFSDYFKQKQSHGKISLRRFQWKAAEAGDKTMLVWLGKQYLNQKDKQEIENNVKIERTPIDELVQSIEAIKNK